MEEKNVQRPEELSEEQLEKTAGGIGERHFPDFRGLRERDCPDFQGKRDFDKGLVVGNPDF